MGRYDLIQFIILVKGCPEFITIRCGDPAGSADGVADAVSGGNHRLNLGSGYVETACVCCQLVAEFVNRGNCSPELVTVSGGYPTGGLDSIVDIVGSTYHCLDLGGRDVEATGMNRYKVMKFIILLEGCPELIAVRSGDPTGSANGIADIVGSCHHRLDLGGSDVEAAGVCSQLAVEVSDGRVEIGTQPTGGQVDSSLVCFCDSCAQVRQVFGKTRFKVLSSQVHVGLVSCGNACLHVGEVSGKLRLQSFGG